MPIWTIFTFRHHGDPIRHHHRLVLIMGHQQDRDADAPLDLLDLDLQLLAQLSIQRRQRFVEQQCVGCEDQRSRQCDPLLLPPDSSCGSTRSRGLSPTFSNISVA